MRTIQEGGMTVLFAKPPLPSNMKQLIDKFYLYTSPVDRISNEDSTNEIREHPSQQIHLRYS